MWRFYMLHQGQDNTEVDVIKNMGGTVGISENTTNYALKARGVTSIGAMTAQKAAKQVTGTETYNAMAHTLGTDRNLNEDLKNGCNILCKCLVGCRKRVNLRDNSVSLTRMGEIVIQRLQGHRDHLYNTSFQHQTISFLGADDSLASIH